MGDWAISQNLFSNLVELSVGDPVRPALAESWSRSPDGLTWIFVLRNGLKWSDGSGMQVDQVVASIQRALAGTSHTQMSCYVKSVAAIDVCRIKFVLNSLPENFLINLAFADLAIAHPKAYENGFLWNAPSSGPYRAEEFSNDTISLKANPFFWDPSDMRPQQITMVRANGDTSDIELLLSNENINAAQLPPGLIARGDELNALKKSLIFFTAT